MLKIVSTLLMLSLCISSQASEIYNEKSMLADINNYRFKQGLTPLKINDFMSKEAKNHSLDMAQKILPFSHDHFKDRTLSIANHFKGFKQISENVAYTDSDINTIVQLWLNSPGHRKNIEGNYTQTGIGIAHDKNGRTYATEIFLK